jgi:hypothetical protein
VAAAKREVEDMVPGTSGGTEDSDAHAPQTGQAGGM